MNAFIRKELRMLLPAWLLALVTATSPAWFFFAGMGLAGTVAANLSPTIAGLGIVPLAMASFGQEISLGTFGFLLAQPGRGRIWRAKTELTLLAMFSAMSVFILCWWLRTTPEVFTHKTLWHLIELSGAFLLAFYSGALWSTLLLRNVMVALCLTLLAPIGFSLLVVWILPDEVDVNQTLSWVLGIYALAGFLWARWQFLRAQDTQWTGGTIFLTIGKKNALSARLPIGFASRNRVWATLHKEAQLQQPSILLAGGILLFHVAAILLRKTAPGLTVKFPMLSGAWMLWLFVPFVAGSLAVAEERRLNTLEASLSLPMRRRTKFLLKLGVVLALASFAGVGGPLAVEQFGRWIGAALPIHDQELWGSATELWLAAIVISGVSFYVSTLARNALQALGAALIFIVGGGGMVSACHNLLAAAGCPVWMTWPFIDASWFVMVAAVLGLAYQNFSRVQPTSRMWIANIFTLSGVFAAAMVGSGLIYYRAWEFVISPEPHHGPARITGLRPPQICGTGSNVFVLLPDGALWVDRYRGLYPDGHPSVDSDDGRFMQSSNWVAVAASYDYALGVQSNGTLWRIGAGSRPSAAPAALRIGQDADWTDVASYSPAFRGREFFALKRNGTLWKWSGTDASDLKNEPNPFTRVGSDSDWIKIVGSQYAILCVKNNNTVWTWGSHFATLANGATVLMRGLVPERIPLQETNWSSAESTFPMILALSGRGEVWSIRTPHFNPKPSATTFRIPSDIRWRQLTGGQMTFGALATDGRFWMASLPGGLKGAQELFAEFPNDHEPLRVYRPFRDARDYVCRPSQYSDWVGIGIVGNPGLMVALAADGALSGWFEPPTLGAAQSSDFWHTFLSMDRQYYWMEFSYSGIGGTLFPSRRPGWTLNLFD